MEAEVEGNRKEGTKGERKRWRCRLRGVRRKESKDRREIWSSGSREGGRDGKGGRKPARERKKEIVMEGRKGRKKEGADLGE